MYNMQSYSLCAYGIEIMENIITDIAGTIDCCLGVSAMGTSISWTHPS